MGRIFEQLLYHSTEFHNNELSSMPSINEPRNKFVKVIKFGSSNNVISSLRRYRLKGEKYEFDLMRKLARDRTVCGSNGVGCCIG
jgi:hypothetical protein